MATLTDTMRIYLDAIGANPAGNNAVKEYAKTNREAFEKAKDAVEAPFDIFSWIFENWKLVIVGFIALLILLRD